MTLHEKQVLFTRLTAEFLTWIFQQPGYTVVYGEVERSKQQAEANAAAGIGIIHSLHLLCLAVDLKLFINGVYQTASETYKPLGDKWKSMHPLARWGGDFHNPDGDHFSLEHEGVR